MADAAAAAAAAALRGARAAAAVERASRDQEAEEAVDRLGLEFAEDIAARFALQLQRLAVTKAIPPLNKKIIKYFCTPAGREVLHQATQSHPIGKSLPPDLQDQLMISSGEEAMELRRSARDLRALLSPSSRALSVIAPLRGKTTFTEVRQELEEIYQMVMATCKDTLRSIYLRAQYFQHEFFKDPKEPNTDYEDVLQDFLHRLLTSLEDVTVLKVDFLNSVVTHETLQILATRHKNLKYFRLALHGDTMDSPFTGAEFRTLTSGCPKLQVLDFNFHVTNSPHTFEPSPEDVVSYLQDLPDLQTFCINDCIKQEGLLLYASDLSNPPHPLKCELDLSPDQEHHWGGLNLDHHLATFPNHKELCMSPITDTYSDSLRANGLEIALFEMKGDAKWSLQSQARFFKKFASSLTRITLSSRASAVWDVHLGAIGQNCLEVSWLKVKNANFVFSELDTHHFQKLKSLVLEGCLNQQTLPPDSFIKTLLSGPGLSDVDLTNVQVSDQALLDLSRSAKERRGGVFAKLKRLELHGLRWPGLRASTVVSVACQAPDLTITSFTVRPVYGTRTQMYDDLVVKKFYERFMSEVELCP